MSAGSKSDIEKLLAMHLTAAGIHGWIQQYRFHPIRRWTLDFAFPALKLGVECDGGIWMPKGAHSRPTNITRDIEKHNALILMGWRCPRVTRKMIEGGDALSMIEDLLEGDNRA